MLVPGDSKAVYRMLTDYDHLDVVNPSIVESRLLGVAEDGANLVYTVLKSCVLFFCKRMRRVEKVFERGDGVIEAGIVPEQSDFTWGESMWKVSSEGKDSRIHYRAGFKPGFSVPPGIGPVLVRYALRRELRQTADRLSRVE